MKLGLILHALSTILMFTNPDVMPPTLGSKYFKIEKEISDNAKVLATDTFAYTWQELYVRIFKRDYGTVLVCFYALIVGILLIMYLHNFLNLVFPDPDEIRRRKREEKNKMMD
jgi:hypothetical protein